MSNTLLWASPPCKPYSRSNHANYVDPKSRYNTIPDLEVREIVSTYGDEYIIENVLSCDDLQDPIKLDGYAFRKPMGMARKFETSFPCESKYHGGRTKEHLVINHRRRSAHNLERAKKKDLRLIKEAPKTITVKELKSFIPPYYVKYLLEQCPMDIDKVVDLYCGVGGVAWGVKKYDSDIKIVGIDHLDKSDEYPGNAFIHGDASNWELVERALDL